jgi:hypothetical protein
MIIEEKKYTYLSGKGPIEQTGTQWTFKCDNPSCGKIFIRKGSRKRVNRSHHYCCHPCSTKHVFGVCAIEDCEEPIKTQIHNRGKYFDLCSKHKKKAQRKERTSRDRATMYDLMGGKCVCCGERNPIFFQVDHVENDQDYRGNYNNGGSLKLRNYLKEPDRYQLLCANCNYAKRINDGSLYFPEKWTRRINQKH